MPEHSQDDEFDADVERDVDATPDAGPDELAWEAIVANYGERVDIDEPPPPGPPGPPTGPEEGVPFGGRFGDPRALAGYDEEPEEQVVEDLEDGYVPPPPPPLPTIAPDRGLAWAGVFGSPVVLLVALILSISIPAWLGYLLVVSFVGGFAYLVLQMPREPRDPWDDGAQV